MARRTIVEFPHPVLKERCAEVTDFGAGLAALLDDMRETMDAAEGLGLAANQVAVALRAFTMLVPGRAAEGERAEVPDEVVELVNPRITGKRGEQRHNEGCLSFPGVYEDVLRAAEVDVAFVDRRGAPQQRRFVGIAAVCVQHELDHLNGVTFLERLSPLKRRLALRSYERAQVARRIEASEELRAAARVR